MTLGRNAHPFAYLLLGKLFSTTPVSDIGERSEGCRLHTNGVQRCGTSVPEAWSFRPRPRGLVDTKVPFWRQILAGNDTWLGGSVVGLRCSPALLLSASCCSLQPDGRACAARPLAFLLHHRSAPRRAEGPRTGGPGGHHGPCASARGPGSPRQVAQIR